MQLKLVRFPSRLNAIAIGISSWIVVAEGYAFTAWLSARATPANPVPAHGADWMAKFARFAYDPVSLLPVVAGSIAVLSVAASPSLVPSDWPSWNYLWQIPLVTTVVAFGVRSLLLVTPGALVAPSQLQARIASVYTVSHLALLALAHAALIFLVLTGAALLRGVRQ